MRRIPSYHTFGYKVPNHPIANRTFRKMIKDSCGRLVVAAVRGKFCEFEVRNVGHADDQYLTGAADALCAYHKAMIQPIR